MRVAFAIFKFFPHGGTARDLAKIVSTCRKRGHDVRIYALEWAGAHLQGVETVVMPSRGVRSHVRQRRFAVQVAEHVGANPVDLVVGMNKMPGLDVYYAADSCFEDKARLQRPWSYRLTSRYRHYAEFERTVFAPDSQTRILTIAPGQDAVFKAVYRTPAYRFRSLPPGIERDRSEACLEAGRALRSEFGVAETDLLLLFVGSGFVKKGLDRVVRGVAALPSPVRDRVRLVVVGDDKAERFERLARRLRIAPRVRFVGGRDDVAAWLQAADALALPAYDEAAGMVILEAACAGVPVVATANCGYAPFLREAKAGIVTPVPFDQAQFNADLERLLSADERELMSRNGRELAANEPLYAMAPRAVDVLETVAAAGEPPLVSFCALEYSKADHRYRSLLPVAQACRRRGLSVRVFVPDWRGPMPDGIDVIAVPVTAVGRNTRRARRREWVAKSLRSPLPGLVVGFDAQGGINIRRWEPGQPQCGRVLDGLPPGLERAPTPPERLREAVRAEFGLGEEEVVLAMAGSDLVSRGFERLFMALGKLPAAQRGRCTVLAAGRPGIRLGAAERVLGLDGRIRFDSDLSPLDAIGAADAFVDLPLPHGRSSNGWIFDALAAGRPVVTHAGVSESRLVCDAHAGIVLASPFRQDDLNRALAKLLGSSAERTRWSANAAEFASSREHFGQAEKVAAVIEQHAHGSDVDAEPLPA
ncbi:MAG: glycosyltransferase [Gammaproteobacteria bacterium]|nr:glycosyltransferase [Gammaproteobacteria bacterium]MDE0442272.1 glycosyltransferase [Gammaproteobacteria bacterium]